MKTETAARPVGLSDKYEQRSGRILLTGVQALVRLMLVQADRDRVAGLSTGGLVTGYRGSPLGTLDNAFAGARDAVSARGIVVQPAVNEELAATAVAGSQQIEMSPGARVEGVYALWYGKGPGLDRASDAIRHGNMLGATAKGGVLVAIGDDHVAKSSTVVCYSDETAIGLKLPLFSPADASEVIRYGLHGFALSRHTGSWAAIKILPEVADATHSIAADELADAPVLPPLPPGERHVVWPATPLEQERRQVELRLPAVGDYVRANRLDRSELRGPQSSVGVVAAGKTWLDVKTALSRLDLDEARLRALGVTLYKPAMIWPLEPEGLRSFAAGLTLLLVVEEKGAIIEDQIKAILYGIARAPTVVGKRDASGQPLLPAIGDLKPEIIAQALTRLLPGQVGQRVLVLAAPGIAIRPAPIGRRPHFCSGCPHNRSTMVPEGSRATAGIGCHGLAAYFMPRTTTFAQMGGEGIHWVGLSPFTDEPHMFANLGDGTYFHSGILAIRQAVAAGVNITYKLLYNSAVAMTGGQPVDGELPVSRIVAQLQAEGVAGIVIVTDDPERYPEQGEERRHARIRHRDELEQVQLELRERPGVTILLYDQMCATERRRQRKRGLALDPAVRLFINDLVCEGCGDCSAKSNCLSIEPIDTAFGTKRRISQSSCNKDFSCVEGFCPSFVTVEGGTLRAPHTVADISTPLPAPPIDMTGHARIVVGGIGGTGVVTIGALLSMAAHIAGRRAAVLDQVGMAQKGGAVLSHVHIADDEIGALRIGSGEADLVIACDQVVGNGAEIMAAIAPGRTKVLANADVAITGDFTQDRAKRPNGATLNALLAERVGERLYVAYPFTRIAERIIGDAIGANLMMLGFAWQRGWLPIGEEGLDTAIGINGAATAMNRRAFALGRRLAIAPDEVLGAANLDAPAPASVEALLDRHTAFLTDYQHASYARRFLGRIDPLLAAERRAGGDGSLTAMAARSLFKLMAYKDEYEVARLFVHPAFRRKLTEQFEGRFTLAFHLAPPIFGRRDAGGVPRKRRFGPWMMTMFRLLAHCKGLRGSKADIFGYSAERREERALVVEFEAALDLLIDGLSAAGLADAAAIVALPLDIRGFGHVKQRAIPPYRATLTSLLAAFQTHRQFAP